ncbi:MAG: DMT family transporter [Microbacteriaceae bacterium]
MRFVLAVIVAGILFGTTGTAQALGTDGSNPISVGAARLVFGGGLLALVSWWMSKRRTGGTGVDGRVQLGEFDLAPDPDPDPIRGSAAGTHRVPTWLIAVLGGLGVLAYQPCFFGGTQLNGVAVGTVVALGSAPVFTGVFEGLLNRRFPGRTWAIATSGAIIGVTVLALASAEGSGSAGPLGLLVSAGAGLAYATYTVFIKMLLGRGWSSSTAVGTLFGLAAVGALPLLVLSNPTWITTTPGISMVIWLALVTTVVANLLFGFGLVGLNASTVSTLTLAEPLTASLLGLLLLHEQLSVTSSMGLLVLGAAIVYLAAASGRKQTVTKFD